MSEGPCNYCEKIVAAADEIFGPLAKKAAQTGFEKSNELLAEIRGQREELKAAERKGDSETVNKLSKILSKHTLENSKEYSTAKINFMEAMPGMETWIGSMDALDATRYRNEITTIFGGDAGRKVEQAYKTANLDPMKDALEMWGDIPEGSDLRIRLEQAFGRGILSDADIPLVEDLQKYMKLKLKEPTTKIENVVGFVKDTTAKAAEQENVVMDKAQQAWTQFKRDQTVATSSERAQKMRGIIDTMDVPDKVKNSNAIARMRETLGRAADGEIVLGDNQLDEMLNTMEYLVKDGLTTKTEQDAIARMAQQMQYDASGLKYVQIDALRLADNTINTVKLESAYIKMQQMGLLIRKDAELGEIAAKAKSLSRTIETEGLSVSDYTRSSLNRIIDDPSLSSAKGDIVTAEAAIEKERTLAPLRKQVTDSRYFKEGKLTSVDLRTEEGINNALNRITEQAASEIERGQDALNAIKSENVPEGTKKKIEIELRSNTVNTDQLDRLIETAKRNEQVALKYKGKELKEGSFGTIRSEADYDTAVHVYSDTIGSNLEKIAQKRSLFRNKKDMDTAEKLTTMVVDEKTAQNAIETSINLLKRADEGSLRELGQALRPMKDLTVDERAAVQAGIQKRKLPIKSIMTTAGFVLFGIPSLFFFAGIGLQTGYENMFQFSKWTGKTTEDKLNGFVRRLGLLGTLVSAAEKTIWAKEQLESIPILGEWYKLLLEPLTAPITGAFKSDIETTMKELSGIGIVEECDSCPFGWKERTDLVGYYKENPLSLFKNDKEWIEKYGAEAWGTETITVTDGYGNSYTLTPTQRMALYMGADYTTLSRLGMTGDEKKLANSMPSWWKENITDFGNSKYKKTAQEATMTTTTTPPLSELTAKGLTCNMGNTCTQKDIDTMTKQGWTIELGKDGKYHWNQPGAGAAGAGTGAGAGEIESLGGSTTGRNAEAPAAASTTEKNFGKTYSDESIPLSKTEADVITQNIKPTSIKEATKGARSASDVYNKASVDGKAKMVSDMKESFKCCV